MQANGTGVVQLTRNDAYDGTPAWSPDGRTIVFASERDGNEEVYRMKADGLRILCTRSVGTSVDIFVITLRE